MLHANSVDSSKIEKAITDMLDAAKSSDKKMIFVDTRIFYDSCKVSSLRLSKFQEEVNDILSSTSICKKYGVWLFPEFGNGYSVFMRVSPTDMQSSAKLMTALVDAGEALEFHTIRNIMFPGKAKIAEDADAEDDENEDAV